MIDRSEKIKIGGQEYNLVLTTRATKEISARYGGLEKLGEKLYDTKDLAQTLDEIVWLVVLLANQGVLIHNINNPGSKKRELTSEEFEILTTPADIGGFKDAIMAAMVKGSERHVESEDSGSKNAAVE